MDTHLIKKWHKAIDEASEVTSFIYGLNDCAPWVNKIVFEVLGKDFIELEGWQYSTKLEAMHKIKTISNGQGFFKLIKSIALKNGWSSIAPTEAKVGCVGLIKEGRNYTLAINRGEYWVCRTKKGVAVSPNCRAILAWEIL